MLPERRDRKRANSFIAKVKTFINRLAILPERWEEVHLPVHGFVNGWASATPQETDFIWDPNGHALALDRRRFEQQLLEAAVNRGAETRLGWIVEAMEQATDAGWRIALRSKNDVGHCDARYLLLATGRHGVHAISRVQRRKFDRLAFLAAHIPGPVVDRRPFIECFESGWVYVTPVPGDARVIYVFFEARLGPPFRRTLGSLRGTLECCSRLSKLLDKVPDDQGANIEWFAGTAHSGLASKTVGQNWCLLGDLAESRDPLSVSGLFNALRDASRMSAHLLSGGLTAKASEEMDVERARSFADYLETRQRLLRRREPLERSSVLVHQGRICR